MAKTNQEPRLQPGSGSGSQQSGHSKSRFDGSMASRSETQAEPGLTCFQLVSVHPGPMKPARLHAASARLFRFPPCASNDSASLPQPPQPNNDSHMAGACVVTP
jgi:hypothetical protein